MNDDLRNYTEWQEFEKTGSITAYLKYKGIYNKNKDEENNDNSHTEVRDGEPVGYY